MLSAIQQNLTHNVDVNKGSSVRARRTQSRTHTLYRLIRGERQCCVAEIFWEEKSLELAWKATALNPHATPLKIKNFWFGHQCCFSLLLPKQLAEHFYMDGEFLTSQSNHSIRGLMNPSIHCLLMHQNEVGTWVGWRQGFEKDDPSAVTRVWGRWPFTASGVTRVWERLPFRCEKGLRKMTLWVTRVWERWLFGVTRVWERWPFGCDKGLRKMTLQVSSQFATADNIGSIPRFGSPFSSKVVIYGHHLATLPLTVITMTLTAASPNAKNISSGDNDSAAKA